jgi:hypothetical protein
LVIPECLTASNPSKTSALTAIGCFFIMHLP